jgi:peptide/nickel transport system permease protein
MTEYVIRRLLVSVVIIFGVSLIVFMVMHMAPGDPVMILAGLEATPEVVESVRREWGFDQPVYVQYLRWFTRAIRLDLGRSVITGETVSQMILSRLPNTLKLNLVAYALALSVGIPVGIVSALRHYSIFDHFVTVVALLGVSMPAFWLGLMLIILFSLWLSMLPSFGMGTLSHYVLPALTLGAAQMAVLMRISRSSVLEVMKKDYIRTARSKGLGERVVIYKHMLKNASIPIITIIGLRLAYIVSGSFIVETIFSWPGIGRMAINSLHSRDYFVTQGVVLMTALCIVLANLLVDVSYAYLDPRIRYT